MIYISGPITGTTDYMKRFDDAERLLMRNGYVDIINPARMNAELPKDTPWEVYMASSLSKLCTCDAIYMMHGWSRSRGARIEFAVAKFMNKKVLMQGMVEALNETNRAS